MKLIPYITYTFLGSLVWNIALVGAGAILGENWERVEPVVAAFQWIVIVLVVAAVARLAYTFFRRRRVQ
jgi:membrane protein DedA with SNARE-associated domain